MDKSNINNIPKCSHDVDTASQDTKMDNDIQSDISKEVAIQSLDHNEDPLPTSPETPRSFTIASTYSNAIENQSPDAPRSFTIASTYSNAIENQTSSINPSSPISLLFINTPPSLTIRTPITTQPCRTSNLPSPISINVTDNTQPQSLFIQALAKLNENSINITMPNHLKTTSPKQSHVTNQPSANRIIKPNTSELTPPDSLTSAPPSYSFVLRQMAIRRRPRLMGTFIPSPSFVQHTPPPNYAAAFDIYVDNHLPPPQTRVYNFGFTSMAVVCPECGYTGMTVVASKITLCTHLCAIILCLLCCWICAPLPYLLRSCKDVYHYCRNCRNFLGLYCPTNPETTYP